MKGWAGSALQLPPALSLAPPASPLGAQLPGDPPTSACFDGSLQGWGATSVEHTKFPSLVIQGLSSPHLQALTYLSLAPVPKVPHLLCPPHLQCPRPKISWGVEQELSTLHFFSGVSMKEVTQCVSQW